MARGVMQNPAVHLPCKSLYPRRPYAQSGRDLTTGSNWFSSCSKRARIIIVVAGVFRGDLEGRGFVFIAPSHFLRGGLHRLGGFGRGGRLRLRVVSLRRHANRIPGERRNGRGHSLRHRGVSTALPRIGVARFLGCAAATLGTAGWTTPGSARIPPEPSATSRGRLRRRSCGSGACWVVNSPASLRAVRPVRRVSPPVWLCRRGLPRVSRSPLRLRRLQHRRVAA